MEPTCIRCGNAKTLIASHVISEFIRNSFFGDAPGKRGKYAFSHRVASIEVESDRLLRKVRRGAQSLPAPPLMCAHCDNAFGATLETAVSRLIASAGLAADPGKIYNLPGHLSPCALAETAYGEHLDDPNIYQTYGRYAAPPAAVMQFARLCTWRAMHAMARSGHRAVNAYLTSSTGSAG